MPSCHVKTGFVLSLAAAKTLLEIVPLTQEIINAIDVERPPTETVAVKEGLKMGCTRMFFRGPVFEYLERMYTRVLTFVVTKIQTRWRATRIAQVPGRSRPIIDCIM